MSAELSIAIDLAMPGPWADHANCRETDPELWFPPDGSAGRVAVTICRECPVRSECLEFALTTHQDFGVWGGLTNAERNQLRKAGRR